MANKNIRGISIKIGADVTELDKAISDAEKSMKKASRELGEIDRAIKKSPDSIDLWNQKQKVLNDELSASREKLKTLTDVQEQMNQKLKSGEISGEQYRAFQRELENTRADVENLQIAAESCSPALEVMAAKGEKMKSAGEAISGAGQKMMGITTAITAAGTAAVMTTANFDEGMSKVSAISGATGVELDMLREKAKEMGERTKFSASEAASAFEYMAMAGWKSEDMIGGIEGIMNLAAASGEDLATTSDIVTDAITAFGMSAKDSGHFADVLATASSNANTNVAMMGETFKYVAPIAGTLGYSVDDAALAIGLMANSGVKASDAGTALRKGLLNLTAPAKAAREEMEDLGFYTEQTIDTFDSQKIDAQMLVVEKATLSLSKAQTSYNNAVSKYGEESEQAEQALMSLNISTEQMTRAQEKLEALQKGVPITIYGYNQAIENEDGSMKSLKETIDFLREHLDGLSESEQAAAAAHIFGTNAVSGMLAIINASDEDYEKLSSSIENCDGAAENMANVMQDNLSGQLTILKSQLEGLAISFGEILMPVIREIVSKIQALVEKFRSLTPMQQQVVVLIGTIVAAIGPVLIVVGKVISLIGTLMTWLPKIKTAITTISVVLNANPIGAVVLSIAALVGAFIYLWNNCEWFRQGWLDFIEVLKNAFAAFAEWFISGWSEFVSLVKSAFTSFTGWFTSGWSDFVELLKNTFTAFVGWFGGAIEHIKQIFTNVKEHISNTWKLIKATFTSFVSYVAGVFLGAFSTAVDSIKNVIEVLQQFFQKRIELIKDYLKNIIEFVKNVFTGNWSGAWENIKNIFRDIWEGFVDVARKPLNIVLGLINGVIDGINKMIGGINSISVDIPAWVPKIGGNSIGFSIPEIPNIPYLAKGGIVGNGGNAIVGEAGPELLSVANGRAVVTPLSSKGDSVTNNNVSSPVFNVYNTVNVENISSDYDVHRMSELLAIEQSNSLAAVGG